MELELRIAQPDVVGRRVRERPIRAEYRELDLLAGLDVATDDQPVRRVPAFHDRPAALPRRACELAVDPHLGVVVDRGLEHGRATRGVEAADALRNRHPDAIPVEREAPVAAARVERRRIDRRPARVVEIAPARVRLDVVGLHGGAGGLLVRSGRLEVGLDDASHPRSATRPCTRVTPSFVARSMVASAAFPSAYRDRAHASGSPSISSDDGGGAFHGAGLRIDSLRGVDRAGPPLPSRLARSPRPPAACCRRRRSRRSRAPGARSGSPPCSGVAPGSASAATRPSRTWSSNTLLGRRKIAAVRALPMPTSTLATCVSSSRSSTMR